MNELFFDSTWQPLLDTLLSGVRGLLDLSQNGFFHLQAQGGDTTGGFDIFSNDLLDKDTFDYMLEINACRKSSFCQESMALSTMAALV